jgi:phosphoacetylglucosamine mutase
VLHHFDFKDLCLTLTLPWWQTLFVDCANGVGGPLLQRLLAACAQRGAPCPAELCNNGDGTLNEGCGADFVQKEQTLPRGFRDLSAVSR